MKRMLILGSLMLMMAIGQAQQLTQPRFHEVQPGETLSTIAMRYSVSPELLINWNDLRSGGMLEPGSLLLVGYQSAEAPPQTGTRSLGQDLTPPPATTVTQEPRYHLVQKGETLTRIGKANGVTVEQLQQWNNIGNINRIYPGERLVVGYATLPEATASGQQASRGTGDFTSEVGAPPETAYLRLPGSTATRSLDMLAAPTPTTQAQPPSQAARELEMAPPDSPEEALHAAMEQYEAATERLPKTYAVVVGVSHYENEPSLKAAHEDAARFYAFLRSPEGGALPEERIRLLTDQNATKLNILQAMREVFVKAGTYDAVLLYFAGYGQEGAFFPYDYDGYNLVMRHNELAQAFGYARSQVKLMLSDVTLKSSIGQVALSRVNAQQMGTYYQTLDGNLQNVSSLNGVAGEETLTQVNQLTQGAFTHALLQGLNGAADSNQDKKVSLGELFPFVETEVRRSTASSKDPQLGGPVLQDWIMSYLR